MSDSPRSLPVPHGGLYIDLHAANSASSISLAASPVSSPSRRPSRSWRGGGSASPGGSPRRYGDGEQQSPTPFLSPKRALGGEDYEASSYGWEESRRYYHRDKDDDRHAGKGRTWKAIVKSPRSSRWNRIAGVGIVLLLYYVYRCWGAADDEVAVEMDPVRTKVYNKQHDVHEVAVGTPPARLPPPLPHEKFLAYTPHSGYHNQRVELENALTLAHWLNRTLLLPPVWLGHAIPYIAFDKMQRRLRMATKDGLEGCKAYAHGGSREPVPRECLGYFSWTQVHWDFLINLDDARKLVTVRDSWNQSLEWLEHDLHLKKKATQLADTFYLKDAQMYDWKFYDTAQDEAPLGKYDQRVNLDAFGRQTEAFKLVHVGTMFGSAKMHIKDKERKKARTTFRTAMVFRNPLLDALATDIRDRMGGATSYFGLHLRVGDGVFLKEARQNVEQIFMQLCVDKMDLDIAMCERVMEENEALGGKYTKPTAALNYSRKKADKLEKALPALPEIRTRDQSPLSSTLTCRGQLHQDPAMLPFNTPVYIATDSKLPLIDPNLALIFNAFPCTFVLSDFASSSPHNSEPLEKFHELNGLRNKDDGVPLASFLYPQLDAQVAAWGRVLVGTAKSTYSAFAADYLHQEYHGWPLVERG